MSSTCKLSMIIDQYIAKNQNLKSTTLKRRQYIWGLLIEAVDDIDIEHFDYCRAEDFQQFLYGRDFSPATIVSYRKAIQSIMSWCRRRGFLKADPFETLAKPRIPGTEIKVYSERDIQAMLAVAPSRIWRARILASVTAGLRRSEGQNLTVRDVNFEDNYISVQSKKETATTWRWSAKNYQVRRVPLCEALSNELSAIMAELPAGQPYLLISEKRFFSIQRTRAKGLLDDRIRTTPDENVRGWRGILSSTGIEGTFHDLRRTAITRWSWCLPPQELKKLAGHSDIATTMKYYAAVRSDVLRRASETSNYLIGATGLEPATS